ncbi:DEAD/DEAH box helicase [Serpentinicella sp. ANB-PHB4]|uniref:DEAD/DEAH box helicase n=1 Tax=Serpentinicella sp. ANB-PHB4 TaxID=3074076 RepID=UPI002854344D|nr:DEAD/DEAH box helicase [Serpentinicella sp. ANB-PHB4]MDR5658692.1 DEAD/DEAH box helicase [Serpentinicella sp. ANB-PHB4]
MATFTDFNLDKKVFQALTDMGFEEATPIQSQTIPTALDGKDVIGQAQTGTGKTAAFGIPLIEQADLSNKDVQGLVLAPTRELAVQVAEEVNKIGNVKGVRALPIYGGQDINRQIKALRKNPQIIVATPGRFMDHMRRKTVKLNGIKMVVLDEADEMLNMGFVEDIETILSEVPTERQTLLFSATMPNAIRTLANKFMSEPHYIAVKAAEITVPNIVQEYIEVPEKQKFDVLSRLLDMQAPELAIVFGRTKRRVDELSEALSKRGYGAEGIHGDLTQNKRDSVLRKFKEGTIEVLVATDVAARGLDISGVTHVYNFDIPQDPESYVHRVGRTGRAGNTGLATTFVNPREISFLKTIERVAKRKIDRKPIPSFAEAIIGQQRLAVEKLLEVVRENDLKTYKSTAEQLLEDTDSVTLLSAALKMLTKEPSSTPVKLTEEAPLRTKKHKGGGGSGGSSSRYRRRNDNKKFDKNKKGRGPQQSSNKGQWSNKKKSNK